MRRKANFQFKDNKAIQREVWQMMDRSLDQKTAGSAQSIAWYMYM